MIEIEQLIINNFSTIIISILAPIVLFVLSRKWATLDEKTKQFDSINDKILQYSDRVDTQRIESDGRADELEKKYDKLIKSCAKDKARLKTLEFKVQELQTVEKKYWRLIEYATKKLNMNNNYELFKEIGNEVMFDLENFEKKKGD